MKGAAVVASEPRIVNLAAALLMAIMAIVQLVAGVMYLVFIWNSYKTLA